MNKCLQGGGSLLDRMRGREEERSDPLTKTIRDRFVLMCIDKGSKGPRLNRPGIISPGIRAPWQAACTASSSSTSPTTLVSTYLGTSTCHRGGGLSRGQMSLQCEQHFTFYRCQEDPNFQKYIKGSKAMLPQVNREKIAVFLV